MRVHTYTRVARHASLSHWSRTLLLIGLSTLVGCSYLQNAPLPGHLLAYSVEQQDPDEYPGGRTTEYVDGMFRRSFLGFATIASNGTILQLRPSVKRSFPIWIYNGKIVPVALSCSAGTAPQVALSPSGKRAICLDGLENTRVVLIDFSRPDSPAIKTVARGALGQSSRSVTFLGEDAVAFLRDSKQGKCRSYNPLESSTEAYIMQLNRGTAERRGCAQGILAGDNGQLIIALVNPDHSWSYVDSNGTRASGDAAAWTPKGMIVYEDDGIWLGPQRLAKGHVIDVSWAPWATFFTR